jgi:pimeloyl-ACP methyl ester carboxylesterase
MTSEKFEWGLCQAIRIFLQTLYGDLYGDRAARGRLIQRFPITQKTMPAGDGTLTFMVAEDEFDKYPHIPVILLHGTPGSALCWKSFLSEPDKYRMIAPDRPGFGPAGGSKTDLDEDIGPLGEMIEKIASENGEVIVAGHSLGAGVAARLAVEHPDMVRGLLLIAGSIDPRLERTFVFQRIFAVPPLSWLFTRSIRSSNRELLQYTGFLEKLRPELAKIKCPVAVIHSRDDRLVPYQNVSYAEKHFTSAAAFKIVSLESGGHFINHTRIDAIKQALEKHVVGA